MKCKVCKRRTKNKSGYCSVSCYYKDLWVHYLDEDAIIINGNCYHDKGYVENGVSRYLGFNGRVFSIAMKDGRRILTNNLWHDGIIPEDIKVEDNAVFLN